MNTVARPLFFTILLLLLALGLLSQRQHLNFWPTPKESPPEPQRGLDLTQSPGSSAQESKPISLAPDLANDNNDVIAPLQLEEESNNQWVTEVIDRSLHSIAQGKAQVAGERRLLVEEEPQFIAIRQAQLLTERETQERFLEEQREAERIAAEQEACRLEEEQTTPRASMGPTKKA